ncbi:MAG TPA: glycosyltransferase [Anaerolineaceae bacterium]|nr:glycosyltransferase [Anaerolineaceae bacterium]
MPDLAQDFEPKNKPDISIVIPTLRRVELLERLLASLSDQKLSGCTFEVIVVDNSQGGDQPTRALCQSRRFEHVFDLVYLHQPAPGVNVARNSGLIRARADLVGFIDDDETLPEDWLARALAINQSPSPECFGGPYYPYYTDEKPAWFKDEYFVISLGPSPRWLVKDETLMGGNMVFKRLTLEELGGFAGIHDRSGHKSEYGDDTDLILRVAEKGARLWYDPQLYILHHAPLDRMTVRWFFRSRWLHGRAKAAIRYKDPANRDDRSRLRIILSGLRVLGVKCLEICLAYLKLPFRNRQIYPFGQNYIVEVVCPQISGFSTAWHSLKLNLEKGSR